MNDEAWRAIVLSDPDYDGKFYYGVMTTGIYCRPSCKSRVPVRANVKLFESSMQAVAENFRPCKRCKPDGGRLPNEEWVAQMVQVIEKRFSEELTLGKLADMFHGSPYHLQRTFKRIHGISPSEFLLRTRMKNAQSLLANSDHSIMDIASAVGIANTSHFSTQFLRQTGNTPTQYRNAARKTDQREATPRLNDK